MDVFRPAGAVGEAIAERKGTFVIHIDVHQEKGERFRVLRTTDRMQMAMMTLPPGGSTANEDGLTESDAMLYVIEGRIELVVGEEKRELRAGEAAMIPAATAYRLRVVGRRSASVLNVFGPPAYPAETAAEDRPGLGTQTSAGWQGGLGGGDTSGSGFGGSGAGGGGYGGSYGGGPY